MHILTVLLLLTSGCVRHYHYNVVVNPSVQEKKDGQITGFTDPESFLRWERCMMVSDAGAHVTPHPCDIHREIGAVDYGPHQFFFETDSVGPNAIKFITCSPYDPMFKTDLPKCK